MFKLTSSLLLLITFIVAIASSTTSATVVQPKFGAERLFKSSNPKDDTICCMPPVFSLKMAITEIMTVPNRNSSSLTTNIAAQVRKDLKSGKVRIDMAQTLNGKTASQTRWVFKVNSTTAVQYISQGNSCDCSTESTDDVQDFNPTCFSSQNMLVSNAKFGQYPATRLIGDNEDSMRADTWLFRETQMAKDTCWLLTTFASSSGLVSETVNSDMVEMVDPNYFKVPPICPPLPQCLANN